MYINIITKLKEICFKRGLSNITLRCYNKNILAIKFYESQGFIEYQEEINNVNSLSVYYRLQL